MKNGTPTALVTGSSGLIGSEAVDVPRRPRLCASTASTTTCGADFFGDRRRHHAGTCSGCAGDARRFEHHELDIRDRAGVAALIADVRPDLIVHAAAQPRTTWPRRRPFDDFDVNAVGTLNLLEAARQLLRRRPPFVFMCTNKVYGDAPNELPLVELETRWDYADPDYERHRGDAAASTSPCTASSARRRWPPT